MTSQDKILQLRHTISESLCPIINRDYYLLEVPYYTNIGDTLIWQGERDFLSGFPYHCKGAFSLESFRFPKIDGDVLIIFQGGGNFGDLWCKHHDFKMKVVEHYPNNEFLFMPQTVFFQDNEKLKKCAEFLSHYNVTICARDQHSFELLIETFKNRILLVPDMAFCMNIQCWDRKYSAKKPLLLKRIDIELRNTDSLMRYENADMEISDWPTIYNQDVMTRCMYISKSFPRKAPWLADLFCTWLYRPYLIRVGVKFLRSHSEIITTRLHGAILSLLLGMKVSFIDNSYGKNRQFYDTWLKDCECISMEG